MVRRVRRADNRDEMGFLTLIADEARLMSADRRLTGCSKRPANKAAGSESPRRYIRSFAWAPRFDQTREESYFASSRLSLVRRGVERSENEVGGFFQQPANTSFPR